uniref:CSON012654 protein n=1 Tax=Culicoides sonorensis TaxID=179676 RepID=A0A336M6M9_CULSO
MKTRNRTIDVQNLLGISTRSKRVSKKKIPSKNDENMSKVVDVSDKENAQNQRKLQSQNLKRRQILSPLKAKSGQSPVKLKNIVISPLNVLSIRRTAPEATSTPHPVRRSLFSDCVEEENVPKDPDPIILSDSDCTDTEVDLTVLSDSDCTDVEVQPQRSTDNNKKRVRKKRVESNPIIKQSKRTIKPTLKALNSPMHRKFFATPRIETCIEDPLSKHVKLNKKGEPVVEVPSRKVLTEAQTKSKKNKKNPEISKDDAKRMPAPVVPVKKTRVKRAVRLYSEPKPVPKNVETVPKYRQELEQQEKITKTLQRSDSAMGDDDIYNFHPSQEIIEEPQKEDSYIKELIVKLKKRKKPIRRRKNVKTKNHEKEQELVTNNEQSVIEIQDEPKNKVDSVMERIRKRLSEKNPRHPVSGPRESTNRKSVTFQIENESLVQDFNQENVPLAHSSVILNRSTNIQNKSVATPEISMMLPPIVTPELNNSSRVICDPVPGTSTGGWTTPGQKTAQHAKTPHKMKFNRTLNQSVLQSSANRSINSPNSPWRVNEEANVPRTKYFCLSKDLLPSYSSDVIVKDTIPFVPDRNSTAMESNANNSFHNSSDAENIAPDPVDKSAIVRPTAKRVPLGAIEISDVIATPEKHHHQPLLQSPLVRHSITNDQIQAQQRKRPQIEIISNVPVAGQRYRLTGDRLVVEPTNKSHDSSNDQSCSGTSDVSDCFGFDISATIDEIPEEEVSQSDLKEKLKRLKHVFPLEKSVSQDVEMPVLFKSPMKQTNTLRDMFDLNMSAKKTKNKESEQKSDDQKNISSESDSDERVQDISTKDEGTTVTQTESIPIKLFDDPEDVTVKKLPDINRRSYAGRQKRKRVHYSDYETSSSETENHDYDDEGISNKHRHKRKKRAKPDIEKTEEFQEFVNEFNSMCDEVEKYELVIEPIE